MRQEDSVDDDEDATNASPVKKKASPTKRKGEKTPEVEGEEEDSDEPLVKDEEGVDEDV